MRTIDRTRLRDLLAEERRLYAAANPRSRELFERARRSLLDGVPMNWMVCWATPFPLFADEAQGARLRDVDGHEYIDFCLGDTGAMTGHAPLPTVQAVREQAGRGITFMLPTEDALWVGEELARRFGLPYWQFTLSATDANRFAIRLARQITGRPRILVFNRCYHGTVDESFIVLEDGVPRSRRGNIGPPVDPVLTTRVVEFNDPEALEEALAPGDVACVLAEPAMTNVGIVLPEPGFHQALREITWRAGTLLILDETHTLCVGPGGYTGAHGLRPDIVTLGKAIAGGIPAGAYGLSEEVAARIQAQAAAMDAGAGGIGGTLAGNALSLAAVRATLEQVLTEAFYAHAIPLAERFARGVQAVIDAYDLPWHVTRLGCRVEYRFSPLPPRNGGQAAAAVDRELEAYLHLAVLNRGILLTPFHNMALLSPHHTEADVDRHTVVLRECVEALLGEMPVSKASPFSLRDLLRRS